MPLEYEEACMRSRCNTSCLEVFAQANVGVEALMLLDPKTQPAIDALIWHSFPDEKDGILADEIWKCGTLVCTILKNPASKSGEDLVNIPYSMIVKRGKKVILAVSLEQEDLRSLSYKLGCSLRELQEDYHTKGNFAELRGYVYTNQVREDLGPYEGGMDLQSIRVFLLETVCDTFDILSEPVQLQAEDEVAGKAH